MEENKNANPTVRLFCYGTLMKGDSRSGFLSAYKFLGKGRTNDEYTLYSLGGFPGMVKATNKETQTGVQGELYEVPISLLDRTLDQIEGVSVNLYARTNLDVVLEETGEVISAVAYQFCRSVNDRPHIGSSWRVRSVRTNAF